MAAVARAAARPEVMKSECKKGTEFFLRFFWGFRSVVLFGGRCKYITVGYGGGSLLWA